jgi:hypothetical protein
MNRTIRIVAVLVVAQFLSASAFSQVRVSNLDVQRLEEDVQRARAELAALRSGNPDAGRSFDQELNDLGDEVIYLKVKVRRNESVTRADYLAVRDHLEELRGRIQARRPGAIPPAVPRNTPAGDATEVPVGTEFEVVLQGSLSSATARAEDRFEATLAGDTPVGTRLMPAGSLLRGVVSSVDRPGRVDRGGRLTLIFDRVTINGRGYPIRATVTHALESGLRDEAGRLATGAGLGAVIGGLLGGTRGALVGILVGGGGVIAATEGKDVELPAGTILKVRLDTPLILP